MKKTLKAIGVVASIIGLIAAMGIVLAGNKKKIDEKNKVVDRSNVPVSVSVAKVALGDISGDMNFSGIVESQADADVTVNAPGTIKTLNIAKGMWVRKGQVLGNVDSEQLKLQLKALELTEAKLTADLDRVKTLVDGNAAPANNLRDLEFNLASTKIQIEQVNQRIADNAIVSPISGMVLAKMMEAGEFCNPGMPIARIVDVASLKVGVFINEKHIYQIKDDQMATVTSEALPGKSFQAKVNYISPIGDENHNYRVEVQLDGEGSKSLKAGTFTLVNLGTTEAGKALLIPANALVTGTKETSVFIAEGDSAKSVAVVTGRRQGDMVEVISGLKEGDQVITAGQINLTEGSLIAITNQ